jgi:hypothetical protein
VRKSSNYNYFLCAYETNQIFEVCGKRPFAFLPFYLSTLICQRPETACVAESGGESAEP